MQEHRFAGSKKCSVEIEIPSDLRHPTATEEKHRDETAKWSPHAFLDTTVDPFGCPAHG
jgi:hypothetical protein